MIRIRRFCFKLRKPARQMIFIIGLDSRGFKHGLMLDFAARSIDESLLEFTGLLAAMPRKPSIGGVVILGKLVNCVIGVVIDASEN